MPIRKTFNRPKIIPYHRRYGSVSVPPLVDQGIHGKIWPNGSAVLIDLPRVSSAVMGWICFQDGARLIGVFVCTIIGPAMPHRFDGKPMVPANKRFPYVDTVFAQEGTYKHVTSLAEGTPHHRVRDTLEEAYEELHDLVL
jgi:hypothetical protein